MNQLVGSMVVAAVVLELVGLVGVALAGLSVTRTVTLWLFAVGLLVVARGYERLSTPSGYDPEVSR
jgi:hypothetical protein